MRRIRIRVDYHLAAVLAQHRDDFEHVPGSVGAEVETLALVVLSGDERVLDRVDGVVLDDAVLRAEA